MDHSSFISLLVCSLLLQLWETWQLLFVMHLLNCSIHMYRSFRIINLYSMKNNLSTRVQFLYRFNFSFGLTVSTHFQCYIGQHLFPQTQKVRLFSTFLVQLDFLSQSAFHSGIPQRLHDFLNIFHTLRFNVCAVRFYRV